MNKRIKAESREDLQILLEKVSTCTPEEARRIKALRIDIDEEKNAFHFRKSRPRVDLQSLFDKLPLLEDIAIIGIEVDGKLEGNGGENCAIEKATLCLKSCDQDVVSWLLCRSPNLKYLHLEGASAKIIAKLDVRAEDSKLDHIFIDLETCANELLAWFGEHCPNISKMTIDGFTKNSYTKLKDDKVQYSKIKIVEIRTEKCSEHILPWLASHCPNLEEISFFGPMEKLTKCKNTEKILDKVKKVTIFTDAYYQFFPKGRGGAALWLCDYFPSLAFVNFCEEISTMHTVDTVKERFGS